MDTESPTDAPAAVSGASTTSREPSKAATVPISRTIPVNTPPRLRLVQVRLQQHVLARRLDVEVEEVERRCEVAQDGRAVPAQGRRDEQEHLVHQTGGEERRGEHRPALEQERLDTFGGECAQLLFERAGAQLELRALRERPAAEREPSGLANRSDV